MCSPEAQRDSHGGLGLSKMISIFWKLQDAMYGDDKQAIDLEVGLHTG